MFSAVLIVSTVFVYAQPASLNTGARNAATVKNFIKPPALGDIGKTATSITNALSGRLGVASNQQSALQGIITGFLTDKTKLLPLATSNPAGYLQQFNPLQQTMLGKLRGILGTARFGQMMNLKPTGNNIAANPLSHLFY